MKNTFIKHLHRPWPFRIPAFLYVRRFSKDSCYIYRGKAVVFDESCRYSLPQGDQSDWNKLFGFSLGLGGIHKDSFRFVWRYDPKTDKIEIGYYGYMNGAVKYDTFTSVDFGKEIKLLVAVESHGNYVSASYSDRHGNFKTQDFYMVRNPFFAWGCGLYFGGNRTAPHKMTVTTRSVKLEDVKG